MIALLIIGFASVFCVLSFALAGYFYIQDTDYAPADDDDDALASLPDVKGLEARYVVFEKADTELGIQEIRVLDKMHRGIVPDGGAVDATKRGVVSIDLGKVKEIEKVVVINKKPPNANLEDAKVKFYKSRDKKAVKTSKGIETGDAEVYEYDWLANKWRSGPKVGGFEKHGYNKQGVKLQS